MARLILPAIATLSIVGILTGAGGCRSTGVGDPCIPEQEYDTAFLGFVVGQVNVESKSFQCETRVCLVNHFQGRVTCPFGQDAQGNAPDGAKNCTLPASTQKIGFAADNKTVLGTGAEVKPQCADRQGGNAVYCSCRCANVDGRTDDGARYCSCPDGYQCTQLVASIGNFDQGVTGGYCVRQSTVYDPAVGACGTTCDPKTGNCKDSAAAATVAGDGGK